ncbi:hypothetical protein COCNU_11G000820 [Cocos nucifera]|uniref:Uncharacterized protein n=1 Tax=Cocos nucifera TaxID=13894 RepID=A0A8K0INI4_COCNU|nr:hypothetical protein COCNU_11G000820 [Cocos nucifera]
MRATAEEFGRVMTAEEFGLLSDDRLGIPLRSSTAERTSLKLDRLESVRRSSTVGSPKEFGRGESEGVRPPRKFGLNAGSSEEARELTSSACWKKLNRWEFG